MQNPVYPVHPDGETINEFRQRINECAPASIRLFVFLFVDGRSHMRAINEFRQRMNEYAPAPIRLFVFRSLTVSSTKPINEFRQRMNEHGNLWSLPNRVRVILGIAVGVEVGGRSG